MRQDASRLNLSATPICTAGPWERFLRVFCACFYPGNWGFWWFGMFKLEHLVFRMFEHLYLLLCRQQKETKL